MLCACVCAKKKEEEAEEEKEEEEEDTHLYTGRIFIYTHTSFLGGASVD